MAIKMKVLGKDILRKRISKVERNYLHAMALALQQEGESIADSSKEIVPKETGALARTIFVRPRVRAKGSHVLVGYGAWYAAIVHQRLDVRHENGKAKFLEQPLNDASNGYIQRVGNAAETFAKANKRFRRGSGKYPEIPAKANRVGAFSNIADRPKNAYVPKDTNAKEGGGDDE
jgi:hypothetical protein